MLDALIRWVVWGLLSLRYRITVKGLDAILPQDDRGILFLPNHPALIEPIMMIAAITRRYRVGVLADKAQVDRPVIRTLARRFDVKAILDPGRDRDAKKQIEQRLNEVVSGVNQGQNYLLYPAGRIYRQKLEQLGGNSATETLLRSCPRARVVLARTHGLWGSSFSRASGAPPLVGVALRRGIIGLLTSGLFFAPRRVVTIEFSEPLDLPRDADRLLLNRYLEQYYNDGALPCRYVPYSIWERGGIRQLPEPRTEREGIRAASVSATTRALVFAHLQELTGVREIRDEMRLALDLGLDSLSRVELQSWIEREFGFAQSEGDALETVGDVLLAASGEGNLGVRGDLRPAPPRFLKTTGNARLSVEPGETITEVFLNAAAKRPGKVILADQTSGVKTYRDLITAIFLLRDEIRQLDGQYVGIMLPASVAATLVYLATLFAGKTPVMLNFTTGPRGVEHAISLLSIQHVISAKQLIKRLSSEGFASATELLKKVFYLEDLGPRLTLSRKLLAAVKARTSWRSLRAVPCPKTAVVLFTSGSENVPKAVPLTSRNILTNHRDVLDKIVITEADAMLSMLPPFHSFGLTVNMLLPLMCGLRVVFHSNPTESAKLATLTEMYRATVLIGTPTFLFGVVNAAKPGQLATLRIAVTGAEQCPPRVYEAFASHCPQTTVLEGYGITECSPVVSVNLPGREVPGTIGYLLSSVEACWVDPDTSAPVEVGTRGMLLVRGPSVFEGYLNYSGDSPFVEHAGKRWYRTGDLVCRDSNGLLTFAGRMKRFIKLGGEMVSLPAIEDALGRVIANGDDEGPSFAVESTAGENPEIVLFATFDADRATLNGHLRNAGLSPLHNIRRVAKIDHIPVLGTGKTDYRVLKERLVEERSG